MILTLTSISSVSLSASLADFAGSAVSAKGEILPLMNEKRYFKKGLKEIFQTINQKQALPR